MPLQVANCVREYLETTEVQILSWPAARRLDMNPSTVVWVGLGRTLRRALNPPETLLDLKTMLVQSKYGPGHERKFYPKDASEDAKF